MYKTIEAFGTPLPTPLPIKHTVEQTALNMVATQLSIEFSEITVLPPCECQPICYLLPALEEIGYNFLVN